MALAERLGKSLAEVDALTFEEVRLWRAWWDMRREADAQARPGRGMK